MFKKSIILLTAFLSLFSFSACQKSNKPTTTKPEETSIIQTSTRELTPEEKMDKFIDTMIEQTPEDVPAWNLHKCLHQNPRLVPNIAYRLFSYKDTCS